MKYAPGTVAAMRFAVTGLMNTAVHIAVVMVLVAMFAASAAFSNALAFVVASIFSYVVNTKWSFVKKIRSKSMLRYALVLLLGLVLTIVVSSLAEQQGLHYLLGVLCVVCVLPPVTFLLHYFWTYR